MNDELINASQAISIQKENENVVFIDATFHLPNSGRNAQEEFNNKHIPNARFFDIDKIANQSTDLPHMLPNPKEFCHCMSILGIKNTDLIIIYDNTAFFSSARAWWMFKVFGHREVLILNGGLKAWVENGGKVSNEVNPYNKTNYVNLSYEEKLCENFENIFDNINSNYDRVIIDARARERFCGQVNEPRPGLRKGHIPKSKNLPINLLLDSETKCLKSNTEIKKLFEDIGIVDKNTPLTSTCGSGVTAAGIAFAANRLGFSNIKVYDGSWAEWGSHKKTPIDTN